MATNNKLKERKAEKRAERNRSWDRWQAHRMRAVGGYGPIERDKKPKGQNNGVEFKAEIAQAREAEEKAISGS